MYATNPLQNDTDGDSLQDGPEVNTYGTNPKWTDTDGDSLSDGAEVKVVETNPTVVDSDSNATKEDEANNSIPDGAEDLDGDGVSNAREFALGLDPLDADTDADGLNDRFEIRYDGIDPLTAHTDMDTTPDGAEDLDNDGLVNRREQAQETHPNQNDTDGDGLADGAEVTDHGTDPTVADSDGDGLDDGSELELGTDPQTVDTDGDGTLDGNETFTTSTKDEETGVSMNITGKGDVADDVTAKPNNRSVFNTSSVENATASEVVELESDSEFEKANVTISYNESAISKGSEEDLAVYRYNETLQTFVKVNSSEVNARKNTVSAETEHFSTYTVLSEEAWRDRFDEPLPSNWTTLESFESLANWSCDGDSDCTAQDGAVTIGDGASSSSQSIQSFGTNNTTTNMYCAEFTGEDSDCDDDGKKNWNDECPNQYAETASGCPDSDGDGTLDKNDDCPNTAGEGPNGCPEDDDGDKDSDGDGTLNKYDKCPDKAGDGPNGCPVEESDPDETWFNRTINLNGNVETIILQARLSGEANSDGSFARFTITAEDGTSKLIHDVSQGETPQTAAIDTVTANITEFAGKEVTLQVHSVGDASITLYGLQLKRDTDGDGLFDNVETHYCGVRDGGGNCLDTSVTDPDTDGDGLSDSEEIGTRQHVTNIGEYYTLVSDPTTRHSDSDSLSDGREVRGWNISVQTENNCDPANPTCDVLGYNPDSSQTMRVTADPMDAHSDSDGLTDTQEVALRTDPNQTTTYEVTERHEELLHRLWSNSAIQSEAVEALGVLTGRSFESLEDIQLTDATDDFDFVRADDGNITFQALDGNLRTDTWLSNRKELQHGTLPWDPDSDNDGLTDGQEVKWVTSATKYGHLLISRDESIPTTELQPTNADSDGDGYWDGWIGVYDANNSTNVVLYREHLHDDDDGDGNTTDDGVQGVETVPEQAGTHEVSGTTPGADVTGDSSRDHSNIHIGELHWGTDPGDRESTPSPSYTFEVDFYANSNKSLWRKTPRGVKSQWTRSVERNYAIYGIETDLIPDEVLTKEEINEWTYPNASGPVSLTKFAQVNGNFHNRPDTQYLLVARESQLGSLGADWQSGINTYFLGTALEKLEHENDPPGIVVFTDNSNHLRKTVMHEIAHSYQIGEADDSCSERLFKGGEIYSGEPGNTSDSTYEQVNNRPRWSIMGSGWKNPMDMPPMNGDYYGFSIEELLTATTKMAPPCI